jgi:CDGSH-type Zn-finger protein
MFIKPEGHHNVLVEGRALPQEESYALCRCGMSHNAPFCDGSHAKGGFDGTETASREPYIKRIEDVTRGTTMDLLDDNRCAFARFCHTDRGDIWSLTESDADPLDREAAIGAARDCPAGRLVMVDKEGNTLEDEYGPEIIILQDPAKRCSAGIFVKGPVTIEAADGAEYEVRNRVALCRCGKSENKPFCNAFHVRMGYNDGHL